MSLFGRKEQKTIENLRKALQVSQQRTRQLEKLCEEKDSYFMELMSDALRHRSKLAGKHMADRRSYLNGG